MRGLKQGVIKAEDREPRSSQSARRLAAPPCNVSQARARVGPTSEVASANPLYGCTRAVDDSEIGKLLDERSTAASQLS